MVGGSSPPPGALIGHHKFFLFRSVFSSEGYEDVGSEIIMS
ncbi:MAG: hypothetical protein QXP11_04160 [Sulfolobales archaeon]